MQPKWTQRSAGDPNFVNQKRCPRWSWSSFWPSLCPTLSLLLPTMWTAVQQCSLVQHISVCTCAVLIVQHSAEWRFSTAQCTEWSAKALFLWDEPSSALKGLPTPKRCRWWSRRWLRWPWRWFFKGGCKVLLGSDCVKADDDNDGVTLKYYEVEESGEYADCYHKTT